MTIQTHPLYVDWAEFTSLYEETLPDMYDLPSEHPEDNVPDMYHPWQAQLLSETFEPPDYNYDRRITATELYIYYDVNNTSYYKQPDWFAVLGNDFLYKKHDIRHSYVIWKEKVIPSVVVELLSPKNRKEDLGQNTRKPDEPPTKWEVYEQILCIPYYVIFDRYTNELRVFKLKGNRYYEQNLADNRIWLKELKLGVGLWQGEYYHLERLWLRWYDTKDEWIPTPAEKEKKRADMEKQRAETEKQRADMEKQRAETEKTQKENVQKQIEKERERTQRLLAQLNALGIKPDQ